MKQFFLGAAVVFAMGCQAYAPLAMDSHAENHEVRIRLTASGSQALAAPLGANAIELAGRAITVSDTAVAIAVETVTRNSGLDEPWNHERVLIPASDISTFESRRTSVARSFAAGAIVVGGAVLASRTGGGGDAPTIRAGGTTGGKQ